MNSPLAQELIRVSYGTGIVLGLIEARQDVAPTTAYLLWDRGCVGSCSFCPRANGNERTKKLSRIVWPEFEFAEVLRRLSASPQPFSRVCLQTGFNPALNERLIEIAKELIDRGLTTSVTLSPSQTELADKLLESGADHIGIGLDGASEQTYNLHKKKNWQKDWPILLQLLKKHRNRIEVHLIFGLGDSEETFCRRIAEIVKNGGQVSLFALTPVNEGTAPELASYRRIQVFRYLCENKGYSIEDFFFEDGILTGIAKAPPELKSLLDEGDCFRTSGCGNCNRPYYNERPGQKFYNFPRPLSNQEFSQALKETELSAFS
jgi:biotin synthase